LALLRQQGAESEDETELTARIKGISVTGVVDIAFSKPVYDFDGNLTMITNTTVYVNKTDELEESATVDGEIVYEQREESLRRTLQSVQDNSTSNSTNNT